MGAGGRAGDSDDRCGGQWRHSAWGGRLTGDSDEGQMTAATSGQVGGRRQCWEYQTVMLLCIRRLRTFFGHHRLIPALRLTCIALAGPGPGSI